jgi:hypothetical protein
MSDRPNVPVPDELAAVRAELKRLETREAELRALLFANPDIRTGASWLAEVKEVTSQRVDLKELRNCYPDLVAEQTHPMTVKQIVLSGITEDGEIIPARRFRKEQEATA